MESKSSGESDSGTRGEMAALLIEAATIEVGRKIVNSVSHEEVKEIMRALPSYDSFKVKSKYDDLLLDFSGEDLHTLLFEKRFIQQLNIIKELEQNATSNAPAWRPSKEMSDSDLYRPHRVKDLKELIEKMEQEVQKQENNLDVLKITCRALIESAKMEKQEITKNDLDLKEMMKEIDRHF